MPNLTVVIPASLPTILKDTVVTRASSLYSVVTAPLSQYFQNRSPPCLSNLDLCGRSRRRRRGLVDLPERHSPPPSGSARTGRLSTRAATNACGRGRN